MSNFSTYSVFYLFQRTIHLSLQLHLNFCAIKVLLYYVVSKNHLSHFIFIFNFVCYRGQIQRLLSFVLLLEIKNIFVIVDNFNFLNFIFKERSFNFQ